MDTFNKIKKDPLNDNDEKRLKEKFVRNIDEENLKEYIEIRGEVYTQTECCICYENYFIGQEILDLPKCGHSLHWNCGIQWLRKNGSCPMCRAGVKGQLLMEYHGD